MSVIKRFDEIDILKSFGIILMIMGHIGFGTTFDFYIHAFHMPMFYIISGFLYKKETLSMSSLILKKGKSILVPYIVFALGHLFVYEIIVFFTTNALDFKSIFAIFSFNTENMPIAGALWFLTSLFLVNLIYYFLDKYLRVNLKHIIVLFFAISGSIIPRYFRLPFALDTALTGVGLYQIGLFLRKGYNSISMSRINMCILSSLTTVFGSGLIFTNGHINMRQGKYSNIFLFYFIATLMTIGLYFIASMIVSNKSLIIKELKFIGNNSIVYLCLNQLIVYFFKIIGTKLKLYGFSLVIYKIIIFIIIFFIIHLITKLLNTNKIKWIIGK